MIVCLTWSYHNYHDDIITLNDNDDDSDEDNDDEIDGDYDDQNHVIITIIDIVMMTSW